MSLKGFSASYVAIQPAERSENAETTSQEFVTPFPGSLKDIYANKLSDKSSSDDQIVSEAAAAKNQHATYDAFQRNNKRRKQRKRN